MINSIRQGESYDFDFEISGDDVAGFSATMKVMQYPGDTPAIDRALTYSGGKFIGTLTSAETAALPVGQWFIHVRADDTDEDLRSPLKLYIAKGWV